MLKSLVFKLGNLVGETGIYQVLFPNRIPVFMLHRVTNGPTSLPGTLPAEKLRKHLEYLAARRYQVLRMDELLAALDTGQKFPQKAVLFTIDDGFKDHFEFAASIFDEFGFPLNFFVVTGLLDGRLWPWDDQITYAVNRTRVSEVEIPLPSGKLHQFDASSGSARQRARVLRNLLKDETQERLYEWVRTDLYPRLKIEFPDEIPPEYRPMTWDDARSLQARGHGIYPHTCTHRILSRLPPDEKQEEVTQSLRRVESELGTVPDAFAYPTGRPVDYDKSDIRALQQSGFRMAFTTVPDYVRKGSTPYELPRFSLPENYAEYVRILNRLEVLYRLVSLQSRATRAPGHAVSGQAS